MHGRVDHQSLGTSLHQVGFCHRQLGEFAKALPFCERAAAAKQRGDVHGRVDHQSLANTYEAAAATLAQLGRADEAAGYRAKAAAARQRPSA